MSPSLASAIAAARCRRAAAAAFGVGSLTATWRSTLAGPHRFASDDESIGGVPRLGESEMPFADEAAIEDERHRAAALTDQGVESDAGFSHAEQAPVEPHV